MKPSAARPQPASPPTRNAILEAATRAFAGKGYSNTTMDDIAAMAGVSRRIIYHHFASKREILEAASVEQSSRFLDEVRAAVPADQPFDDYVFGCLCHIIEKAPSSPLFTLDIARDTDLDPVALYFGSPDIINAWVELFRGPYTEALRTRTLRPEVRLEKLVAWFGRITTSYLKYPLPGETQEEIRDSLRVFFVTALRP
jgi:AcrR family transcriptional regulator